MKYIVFLFFLCCICCASECVVDYNSNENTPGFNTTVFNSFVRAVEYCDSDVLIERFAGEDHYFDREVAALEIESDIEMLQALSEKLTQTKLLDYGGDRADVYTPSDCKCDH